MARGPGPWSGCLRTSHIGILTQAPMKAAASGMLSKNQFIFCYLVSVLAGPRAGPLRPQL